MLFILLYCIYTLLDLVSNFVTDYQGRTPLAIAMGFAKLQTGYMNIVECLLRRGAKTNTLCGKDDSALDHGIHEGMLESL